MWYCAQVMAQSYDQCCDNRGKRLNLSPHYGFIIPHTAQMSHLIQGHSVGLGAQCLWGAKAGAEWNEAYNYPDQGIDVFLNYTGNPEQLGYQLSLSYLVDLPLNRLRTLTSISHPQGQRRKRSFPGHYLGLGIGTGISSRRWDLLDNRQAAVIGSHLNAAITLQYKTILFRSENSELFAGLRITHFSNGAFTMPNLGTNNVSAHITWSGMTASYVDFRKIYFHPVLRPTSHVHQWRNSIGATMGLKEIAPPNGRKYASYTMGFLSEYQGTRKSIFGAGIDLMYNTSIGKLMERRDGEASTGDIMQVGALVSYSLLMNRFEVKFQQGFYLVDKWKDFGLFYHRFGLRYHFTERLMGQLTLKTHFAKADHGELGIGWLIFSKSSGND
ncbi:MAG: hypothetical protein RL220_857 [Bacteroidota bacterium]